LLLIVKDFYGFFFEDKIGEFAFVAGSLYDILRDERLNHRVEVETGVMEEECAKIMQDFFRQSRERKKEAKRLAKLETRQDM